jgi:tRNA U38,U39,U40 pseudouridine synthase TruA
MYAIAGPIICGAVVSFWYLRRRRLGPLKQLHNAYCQQQHVDVILKDVYRFKDDFEVRQSLLAMTYLYQGACDGWQPALATEVLNCLTMCCVI